MISILIRLVKLIVRSVRDTTIAVVLYVTVSTLFFSHQNKDLCIKDSILSSSQFKNKTQEVLEEFAKQGVSFQLGCGPYSVKVERKILPMEVIAQTNPYGISLYTSHNPPKEMFIPMFHVVHRSLTFNKKIFNTKVAPDLFQSTLVHELGHLLGAPHVHTNPLHVMNPYLGDQKYNLKTSVKQVVVLTKRFDWNNYFH